MCYLGKGLYEEALQEFQGALMVRGRTPETVAWLAVGYAAAGHKEKAAPLLDELKGFSKKQYVPKTFFAYIYAALADRERAFETLESAYWEHDSTLIGLKTHPWLDPLRSDPRFASLERRLFGQEP